MQPVTGEDRHPTGLGTLFLTELWERLGFYTLMAVLTLYMDQELGWSDGAKGTVYGIFLGLCYCFPLLGGWLGDRVLGPRATVRAGAALMTLGYVSLGLSSRAHAAPFLAGLLLVGVGTGILKVNMSLLVGALYTDRPRLRDAGFNLYYMGVNIGAAIAPLAATAIGIWTGGYRLSFWMAAVGMVIAQFVFVRGSRQLPDGGPADEASGGAPAMDRAETRQRVLALGCLFLVAFFFWTAFYQNGFAMTLFAARSTRSHALLRPETYQFFQPAFILVFTPAALALFAAQRKLGREPSTPGKIFAGMVIMAASMLVMALACQRGGNLDLPIMGPGWLVGTYAIITVSEILISPMGQSYVAKVAPPRCRGLMMGGWFAATAAGACASGLLGAGYGRFPHSLYYLLLAGLLGFAALLTLALFRRLKQFAS